MLLISVTFDVSKLPSITTKFGKKPPLNRYSELEGNLTSPLIIIFVISCFLMELLPISLPIILLSIVPLDTVSSPLTLLYETGAVPHISVIILVGCTASSVAISDVAGSLDSLELDFFCTSRWLFSLETVAVDDIVVSSIFVEEIADSFCCA